MYSTKLVDGDEMMDRDDDGETFYKYNTFVDDVALEPTYLHALPTAAGRNVATEVMLKLYLMIFILNTTMATFFMSPIFHPGCF